jgi:IrrE N-terminal-like domain
MSNHEPQEIPGQEDLFDDELPRSLLDQLLIDSRMYRSSGDYKKLLDFVVRLRGFAPFNAMLLQVQKPGLSYAASRRDWWERFHRTPKEGARPLLIMWPFGPVALVYDVMDTEGSPLPEDVSSFAASGSMSREALFSFEKLLESKGVTLTLVDAGDRSAGLIRVVKRASKEEKYTQYGIHINQNHEPAVQFTTLAHELGHLFLGHLGLDKGLKIPARRRLTHQQREIEAESVAYILCHRNGVQPRSHTYLSGFIDSDITLDDIDVYQIMRAAGRVESILALAIPSRFNRV